MVVLLMLQSGVLSLRSGPADTLAPAFGAGGGWEPTQSCGMTMASSALMPAACSLCVFIGGGVGHLEGVC